MIENVAKLSLKIRKVLFKSHALTAVISCIAIICTTVVLNAVAKTVNISDGVKTYTVRTMTGDVKAALGCAGIKKEYKVMSTSATKNRIDVSIAYTFPVYITVGDKTVTVKTVESTVEEILNLAGFNLGEHDMVEPSADKKISKTTYIDYTDIDYVTGSYTEAIPCSMETVYTETQSKGVNTVLAGKDGVRQVNYTAKVVNGITMETTVNDIVTLSAAVNGKNLIGTAVPKAKAVTTADTVKTISTLTPPYSIELDSNGVPVNYLKHTTVQATAYTYTGHNCATGVAPQPGYIAVNPKIIPYGTKLYIKSSDGKFIYGYAVAADTGGFVKSRPTNVDLFFPSKSACSSFGRRNVEIYFLP